MKTRTEMPEIKYISENVYWPNVFVARLGTFLFFYVYVCNKSDVVLLRALYRVLRTNLPIEAVQEFKKSKNADELDKFLRKYNEEYREILR